MASMKAARPVGLTEQPKAPADSKAPSASKQAPKKAEPKVADTKKVKSSLRSAKKK